nr:hypothetical protein [Desulfobacula sp.]
MNKSDCIILKMLGVLLAVMLQTPLAWAGGPVNETGETSLNGEILTVAANMILEGIPGSPAFMDALDSGSKAGKKGFYAGIENSVERISAYFFRYFSVNDHSSEIQGSLPRLKNRTRSFAEDPRDFELNLCLDLGYHSADDLNIDAVRIESFLHHTFVTTIYHYEKKEIELGLSNVMINKLLLDGMKLEIQTDSYMNSGAVLFTMTL